ncbi:MAG: alpha/beta fold hydrolase [Gammaproteobacteria bacterium]
MESNPASQPQYVPRRYATPVFVPIRNLRYHCRAWGPADAPVLFLIHGVHDLSASWQFTVDALQRDWRVIAPDLRGFGATQWSGADTYWNRDYLADVWFLLDYFSPGRPVPLVGHSLGGSVAKCFAGLFPERISRLVDVEGIGPPSAALADTPARLRQWIEALADPPPARQYPDFAALAARLQRESPGLTGARAAFLARAWGVEQPDGRILRRSDPAQRQPRPQLWRFEEERTIWAGIRAPALWIEGAQSRLVQELRGRPDGYEARLAAYPTVRRVLRIEGAGHNIHHDQPEALAAAIEEFLAD